MFLGKNNILSSLLDYPLENELMILLMSCTPEMHKGQTLRMLSREQWENKRTDRSKRDKTRVWKEDGKEIANGSLLWTLINLILSWWLQIIRINSCLWGSHKAHWRIYACEYSESGLRWTRHQRSDPSWSKSHIWRFRVAPLWHKCLPPSSSTYHPNRRGFCCMCCFCS